MSLSGLCPPSLRVQSNLFNSIAHIHSFGTFVNEVFRFKMPMILRIHSILLSITRTFYNYIAILRIFKQTVVGNNYVLWYAHIPGENNLSTRHLENILSHFTNKLRIVKFCNYYVLFSNINWPDKMLTDCHQNCLQERKFGERVSQDLCTLNVATVYLIVIY